MTTDDHSTGEITFKYIFADDYNPTYVNGVYGGINPKGDLALNFFYERSALPNKETYALTPAGTLGKVEKCFPEDLKASMVRFISTGIILDLRGAKDIFNWLKEKINDLEKFNKLLSDSTLQDKD